MVVKVSDSVDFISVLDFLEVLLQLKARSKKFKITKPVIIKSIVVNMIVILLLKREVIRNTNVDKF